MEEKDKLQNALFIHLVLMFHASAMQSMGKLKNPITDKVERDLQQAKVSIDMLDMLAEKTKGNLSEDEEKFLINIIDELKLNYVDEVNKDKQAQQKTENPNEPESAKTSS